MNFNTKSLIIGWFSALVLLWLVVALNSNASTVTQEGVQEGARHSVENTQQVEAKRQTPLGF